MKFALAALVLVAALAQTEAYWGKSTTHLKFIII